MGKLEYKEGTFEEYKNELIEIRRKVFIEEQKCPEHTEWDDNEEKDSLYFICLDRIGDELKPAACLRIRKIRDDLIKLERVAVMMSYRRRRIASELIRNAMIHCQTKHPKASIYAYAQVTALQLYISLGFTVLSKVWVEDETFIRHQTIFWSTPEAIQTFLNYEKDHPKSTESLEEYSVHHPISITKIEQFKERLESLEWFNLKSLHLLLDDNVVTKLLRQRFQLFCDQTSCYLKFDESEKEEFNISNFKKDAAFFTSLCFEKLNTGHFSEVDENWRILYALVTFVKSFILYKHGNYKVAMEIADQGLCMGRVDEQFVPIRKLAFFIHSCLPIETIQIHECYNKKSAIQCMNSLPNSVPIREICDNEFTFEELIRAVHEEKPIIIRNFASNMPAVKKWNFDFLIEELHSRTFPVEIGTKYSDEDWSQQMMTFHEFISNTQNQQFYLAQHRLFDQVPHLKNDLIVPDICYMESNNENNVDMNMWIGPSGTVSPLHTDPRKNLFVQIHGSKLFRMISPSDSECVYPFDGMLGNTSQVDVENPDIVQFPLFSNAVVYDGVVHSGDALYIPVKWWHFVRSTSPSISVSFWFD